MTVGSTVARARIVLIVDFSNPFLQDLSSRDKVARRVAAAGRAGKACATSAQRADGWQENLGEEEEGEHDECAVESWGDLVAISAGHVTG